MRQTGLGIFILGIWYVRANKRAGDGFLESTTLKIEELRKNIIICCFHFPDLIRNTLDDRHSRPSLLAHFHLPRNMYYVPARETKRLDLG